MVDRTSDLPNKSRLRAVGILWLVVAVPALVLGVIAQMSDNVYERIVGMYFLVLGALAVGIGFVLRRYFRREVANASLAISALWVFGGLVGLVPFKFLADRLLFGLFPAVAGILTAVLIIPLVRRTKDAAPETEESAA